MKWCSIHFKQNKIKVFTFSAILPAPQSHIFLQRAKWNFQKARIAMMHRRSALEIMKIKPEKTFATLYKMLLQYITAYLYGHQVWILVLCGPTPEY